LIEDETLWLQYATDLKAHEGRRPACHCRRAPARDWPSEERLA
jgi:hypothetical protein